VRDSWRALRPLVEWISAEVGPSTMPVERR